MATSVIFQGEFEVPFIGSLDGFRDWALSDEFPERGRIDYLDGRIEVDMSPEDLGTHGKVKIKVCRTLDELAEASDLGEVFVDSTRVSCPETGLSVEPDVVFVSHEALESGRVRLKPKARGADRYVELEGPPDLIVEVVSDSSADKDLRQLPKDYWRAGVREFWRIDARGKDILFQIFRRAAKAYRAVRVDSQGFQRSAVFGASFRLTRRRGRSGLWNYQLERKGE